MGSSKTIKLYLKDGEATGRIKCTIDPTSVVAFKIPRIAIKQSEDIDLLQQSGIYFLFGTDFENYEQQVYVGQADSRKNEEGVLNRISEAHASIDWSEAIIFVSTADFLGSTELNYLENRFYNLVQDAGRCNLTNGNEPHQGSVTDSTKCVLDEFIDIAKIMMGALGKNILEPIESTEDDSNAEEAENENLLLYMNYNGSKATGKRTNEGFIVYKGSKINKQVTDSCPETTKRDREDYADKIDDSGVLTADIPFSSSSRAAGFVGGASLSGNEKWHDSNGNTLRQIDNGE